MATSLRYVAASGSLLLASSLLPLRSATLLPPAACCSQA